MELEHFSLTLLHVIFSVTGDTKYHLQYRSHNLSTGSTEYFNQMDMRHFRGWRLMLEGKDTLTLCGESRNP